MKKEKFDIQGMTCSSCSSHVEKAVNKLDGIKCVNVNFLSNNMIVEYDEKSLNSEKIERAVIDAGYGASVVSKDIINNEKEKNKRIFDIQSAGADVEKYIIRHGLTEIESFHLEAALIDIFSSQTWSNRQLLNIMGGYHSLDNGLKSVSEIEAFYCAEDITKDEITHNVLIVNINNTYQKSQDVYEATRKSWLLNTNKVNDIELVISEYKGIFRAIYQPETWKTEIDEKGRSRWLFEGIDVSKDYPQYLNKNNSFKKRGMANPVCYVFGNKKDNTN